MAWTVIVNAEKHLKRTLVFNYDGYRLSCVRSGAFRMEAMIQTLLNRGELTRDPIREKQWLTCQIIKKLRRLKMYHAPSALQAPAIQARRPNCENDYSQRTLDLISRYSIIRKRFEIATILIGFFTCLAFLI